MPILNLLLGNRSGSIGESSVILIARPRSTSIATKTAQWRLIVSTIIGGTVVAAALLLAGSPKALPLASLLAGSFLFVAVFMATDPVSAPKKAAAQWAYGLMIGAVIIIIRTFSLFPEGTSFALLLGNTFASLFDRLVTDAGQAQGGQGRPGTGAPAPRGGRQGGVEMKKESMLYVVLFTFVVCAVFVVVLAVANEGTKDLVAANKAFATQSAVLGAFGIPFADTADAAAKYESTVTERATTSPRSWKATVDGRTVSWRWSSPGPASGAPSRVILAAQPEAGASAASAWWPRTRRPASAAASRKPGSSASSRASERTGGKLVMKAGAEATGRADTDKENGLVDGISGATRTSQSFGAIVNAGLARIKAGGAQ